MDTKTPIGAYLNRPHRTIEELERVAADRATNGEDSRTIIQDIVDGYCFGWNSENHLAIARAAATA